MAASVRAVILALAPTCAVASFTSFTSGRSCEANGAGSIRTLADCSAAAAALGLSDTTAVDDSQDGVAHDPPFCYFEYGSLKFNSAGTNTGGCTSYGNSDAANPVNFTAKGDREVVAQLFFKLVYSITGAAVPQGPETALANFSGQLPRLSMWSKPSAGPAGSTLDSSDIDAAAWWKAAAAANATAPPKPRPRARSAPRAPRRGLWGWLSGLDITFNRRRSVRELRDFDSVGSPTAIVVRDDEDGSKQLGRQPTLMSMQI